MSRNRPDQPYKSKLGHLVRLQGRWKPYFRKPEPPTERVEYSLEDYYKSAENVVAMDEWIASRKTQ